MPWAFYSCRTGAVSAAPGMAESGWSRVRVAPDAPPAPGGQRSLWRAAALAASALACAVAVAHGRAASVASLAPARVRDLYSPGYIVEGDVDPTKQGGWYAVPLPDPAARMPDTYKYIETGHYPGILAREDKVQSGWEALNRGQRTTGLYQDRSDFSAGERTVLFQTLAAASKAPARTGKSAQGPPALAAAEKAGLVQAVSTRSKMNVVHNVITTAVTPAPAAVKKAAVAAVQKHLLDQTAPAAEDAAPTAAGGTPADFAKDPSDEADVPLSNVLRVGEKFFGTQLLTTSADPNKQKVLVKMYMESECPACRRFSETYLKDIVEAPGMTDIMDLEFVPFGHGKILRPITPEDVKEDPTGQLQLNVMNHTSQLLPILKQFAAGWRPDFRYPDSKPVGAEPPMLKVLCQHGNAECEGNAWESCLQDVVPDLKDLFPVIDCLEARSCPADTSTKPPACVGSPDSVVQGCVQDFGQGTVNVEQLVACSRGSRVQELAVMADIATLDANIVWAPWFTVDGTDLIQDPNNPEDDGAKAFREQFLLGKKICDTYASKTGQAPPPACATFPQTDADIPAKPYEKYPKDDFSSVISKQKMQQVTQKAAGPSFVDTIRNLVGGLGWH